MMYRYMISYLQKFNCKDTTQMYSAPITFDSFDEAMHHIEWLQTTISPKRIQIEIQKVNSHE